MKWQADELRRYAATLQCVAEGVREQAAALPHAAGELARQAALLDEIAASLLLRTLSPPAAEARSALARPQVATVIPLARPGPSGRAP